MVTPLIILLLLVSPLSLAFVVSKYRGTELQVSRFAAVGLGCAFVFFSLGHFIKSHGMVDMLPEMIPYRLELVYATGILELLIGLGLFQPKYQVLAAKLAIVVFVVFFPANIYAAFNSTGLGGHQWGPIYLLIRAPLQLILIIWAYAFCIRNQKDTALDCI